MPSFLECTILRLSLSQNLQYISSSLKTVSVFRRPRPVANLKYVMSPDNVFNIKTGMLMAIDPDKRRVTIKIIL